MKLTFLILCLCATTIATSTAAPVISLVGAGTTSTAFSLSLGTASYTLDLRLDTGGRPVSGLDLFITVTGVGASNLKYGSTPLVGLSTPTGFTTSEIFLGPGSGASVDINNSTSLFKSSVGDYVAGVANVVSYTFNTSALAAGVYILTPTGTSFTNGVDPEVSTFGTPGSFTLTVVPEPTTVATTLAGLALLAYGIRRRQLATL